MWAYLWKGRRRFHIDTTGRPVVKGILTVFLCMPLKLDSTEFSHECQRIEHETRINHTALFRCSYRMLCLAADCWQA